MKPYFIRAREIVLEYFYKRYTDELQWDVDEFEKTVVKGCFPLHPLTTSILATHKFQSGEDIGTPRTVLGFVQQQVDGKRNEPAMTDGHPNVVIPIVLVDYFGERLSKKWHGAYIAAIDSLTEKLTEEQRKVLQALFLQIAVKLFARGSEQLDLLSHTSGLDTNTVKRTLRELSDASAIQYDPYQKISSLWPPSAQPQVLDEILKPALEKTPVDIGLLNSLNKRLEKGSEIDLSQLKFGSVKDWSPAQVVLTASFFSPEQLREYTLAYSAGNNKIMSGERGLIIWLVAQTDEEKSKLRQRAESVLDTMFEERDYPLPIIAVLPQRPMPELIEALRRLKTIEGLIQSDRDKLGSYLYEQSHRDSERDVERHLLEMRGGVAHFQDIQRQPHEIVVPTPYRAVVQAIRHPSIKSILNECYRLAYSRRPQFYTHYQTKQKALRDAVKKVSLWLFEGKVGDGIQTLSQRDVPKQLCEWYLVKEWGLLLPTSFDIQRPMLKALQSAWDYFEQVFPPGSEDQTARQMLTGLMNPPYGHDYNTLMLLFAAWIGYNQYELRFSLGGRYLSLQDLKQFFDDAKNVQDFLDKICCSATPLAISRSRPDAILDDANEILERIHKGDVFTQEETNESLALLEQALSNPKLPPARSTEIEKDKARLSKALETAQNYDEQAKQILGSTRGDWDGLLAQSDAFNQLHPATLVTSSSLSPKQIKEEWESALEKKTEDVCRRYESIHDLGEEKANKQSLTRMRTRLKKAGYPLLVKRIEQATDNLKRSTDDLRQRENEKAVVAEIRSMAPSASLKDLYVYRKRLSALSGLSVETTHIRDERLREIDTCINQYETLAQKLPQSIEQVISLEKLNELAIFLLRNLDRVEGTDVHSVLVALQEPIKNLRSFFRELETLKRETPKTRTDATSVEKHLKSLGDQHQSNLHGPQLALIKQAREEFNRKVSHLVTEAHQWLQDIQQRFERGEDPGVLLKDIGRPPKFLIDKDKMQLENLEARTREKLEQDILLHIESLFRSIQDHRKQQECVERLKKVIEDER